jgi:hypothetical protein
MKTTTKKIKPKFSFSLNINGKVYEGKGETAIDALLNTPKPEKITNKGTLYISNGEKSNSVLMQIPQMKRLFFLSKSLLEVHLKGLLQGMK